MRAVITYSLVLVALAYFVKPIFSAQCLNPTETDTYAMDLDPSVCGKSSVDVTITRGVCKNNVGASGCKSTHHQYIDVADETFCVPKTTSTTTETVTVTDGAGCSESVSYRFEDATSCKCEYVGYHLDVSVTLNL